MDLSKWDQYVLAERIDETTGKKTTKHKHKQSAEWTRIHLKFKQSRYILVFDDHRMNYGETITKQIYINYGMGFFTCQTHIKDRWRVKIQFSLVFFSRSNLECILYIKRCACREHRILEIVIKRMYRWINLYWHQSATADVQRNNLNNKFSWRQLLLRHECLGWLFGWLVCF